MMHHCYSQRRDGFTLVELVMSIGIFAFAIVALLGLFPVALKNAEETRHLTYINSIAQRVLEEIRASDPSNVALGLDIQDASILPLTFQLTDDASYYGAFDGEGKFLGAISEDVFEDGQGDALYLVHITINSSALPDDPLLTREITSVEVSITYPAPAPLENRAKRKVHTAMVL